ncbi:MAG: tripartite tricarboxylate transporter substrate binding protein [Burkholderiales bacterium]|nr:tripartite tricarboxylate transporter substrate binding protein [Burkholderiales bacterium]
MPFPRFVRQSFLFAALCAVGIAAASAQDAFPARPVKIVVGSEAGSAPDVLARAVAQEMAPLLGQSVIVENKAGATGTIGATFVAQAPADGYTLLMGTVSNIALAPYFYPIKYDPNRSFTPIGTVAAVPLVLVASPKFGADTFAALKAKAATAPAGSINYASPGVGGPQHLAGVLLQRPLGAPLVHIPYKSGGAAMTAVAAGDVELAFAGIPAAAGLAQGKKVVPILVTASKRSPAMPEVPAAGEVGLTGFDIDNWHALFAPAGLPASVQAVLETALRKALATPAVRDVFQKAGAEPMLGTGAELGAMVAAETKRWAGVVADNKLKGAQ